MKNLFLNGLSLHGCILTIVINTGSTRVAATSHTTSATIPASTSAAKVSTSVRIAIVIAVSIIAAILSSVRVCWLSRSVTSTVVSWHSVSSASSLIRVSRSVLIVSVSIVEIAVSSAVSRLVFLLNLSNKHLIFCKN